MTDAKDMVLCSFSFAFFVAGGAGVQRECKYADSNFCAQEPLRKNFRPGSRTGAGGAPGDIVTQSRISLFLFPLFFVIAHFLPSSSKNEKKNEKFCLTPFFFVSFFCFLALFLQVSLLFQHKENYIIPLKRFETRTNNVSSVKNPTPPPPKSLRCCVSLFQRELLILLRSYLKRRRRKKAHKTTTTTTTTTTHTLHTNSITPILHKSALLVFLLCALACPTNARKTPKSGKKTDGGRRVGRQRRAFKR